jgi:hypothetical protein
MVCARLVPLDFVAFNKVTSAREIYLRLFYTDPQIVSLYFLGTQQRIEQQNRGSIDKQTKYRFYTPKAQKMLIHQLCQVYSQLAVYAFSSKTFEDFTQRVFEDRTLHSNRFLLQHPCMPDFKTNREPTNKPFRKSLSKDEFRKTMTYFHDLFHTRANRLFQDHGIVIDDILSELVLFVAKKTIHFWELKWSNTLGFSSKAKTGALARADSFGSSVSIDDVNVDGMDLESVRDEDPQIERNWRFI